MSIVIELKNYCTYNMSVGSAIRQLTYSAKLTCKHKIERQILNIAILEETGYCIPTSILLLHIMISWINPWINRCMVNRLRHHFLCIQTLGFDLETNSQYYILQKMISFRFTCTTIISLLFRWVWKSWHSQYTFHFYDFYLPHVQSVDENPRFN